MNLTHNNDFIEEANKIDALRKQINKKRKIEASMLDKMSDSEQSEYLNTKYDNLNNMMQNDNSFQNIVSAKKGDNK